MSPISTKGLLDDQADAYRTAMADVGVGPSDLQVVRLGLRYALDRPTVIVGSGLSLDGIGHGHVDGGDAKVVAAAALLAQAGYAIRASTLPVGIELPLDERLTSALAARARHGSAAAAARAHGYSAGHMRRLLSDARQALGTTSLEGALARAEQLEIFD